MSRSMRSFLLSMFITLIIVMFLTGIFIVTDSASKDGKQDITVNPKEILLIGETADNAMTLISPETKAAAHWMLIVCAALSELY